MSGGGKGGAPENANPNLDQISQTIMDTASSMMGTQQGFTDQASQGYTDITGLPSEQRRLNDYKKSLAEMQRLGKSPLEAIQGLGAAPGGSLYSGQLDPLAAAQYGKAVQDDLGGARRANSDLARQFGARGTDESAVLNTLQSENINQARLNRSPLLTAMMDLSRKVEQEQRAADMQSYSANIQSALAQGQALSPLLSTLSTTSQTMLAGRGAQTGQTQSTDQSSTQTQNIEERKNIDQEQSQREAPPGSPFMSTRKPVESSWGGPESPTNQKPTLGFK